MSLTGRRLERHSAAANPLVARYNPLAFDDRSARRAAPDRRDSAPQGHLGRIAAAMDVRHLHCRDSRVVLPCTGDEGARCRPPFQAKRPCRDLRSEALWSTRLDADRDPGNRQAAAEGLPIGSVGGYAPKAVRGVFCPKTPSSTI